MSSAVIIGGTRGIGLSVALLLAKRYANVVVTGRSRPNDLPSNVAYVPMDLSAHDLSPAFAEVKKVVGNAVEVRSGWGESVQ